jgi:hypothetical protein
MAVLIFDESWDAERIEWEIRRISSEIAASQKHIEKLKIALAAKKPAG